MSINYDELILEGYTILRGVITQEWISKLIPKIHTAFKIHKEHQISKGIVNPNEGVAIHAVISDEIFINLLDDLASDGFFNSLESNYFNSNCILNSFSALNSIKGNPNFSSNVHRDLRFYSHPMRLMLNCLIMVDDFTCENGGTFLLPKSHLNEEKPSNEYFYSNAIQVTGKSGDILIFDSNIWHSSAPNYTENDRLAIPFTLSKSHMKQLLDYPRAIGYDKIDSFSTELQKLLGYYSRVPSSIDEWYQPEEKRLYKKNQD